MVRPVPLWRENLAAAIQLNSARRWPYAVRCSRETYCAHTRHSDQATSRYAAQCRRGANTVLRYVVRDAAHMPQISRVSIVRERPPLS